jgi:hypothetical protein
MPATTRAPSKVGIFKAIAPDALPGSLFYQSPSHSDVAAVSQMLARLVDEQLGALASTRMRPSEEPLSLKLRYVPRDLPGALWLQLALAIDARKKFVNAVTAGILWKYPTMAELSAQSPIIADRYAGLMPIANESRRHRRSVSRKCPTRKLPASLAPLPSA